MASVEEIPLNAAQREQVALSLISELPGSLTDSERIAVDEVMSGMSVTIGRLAAIRSIHAKYFNPEEPKKCTNLASMKSPE